MHETDIGSPLSRHLDLRSEADIVWVCGRPEDYPYLREFTAKAGSRARRLSRFSGSLVAYATLTPNAPNVSPGIFERRVWTFQAGDRETRDGGRCPMQAVRPRSIQAGRRSESGRD
jgi:hypothetical protein